MSNLNVQNVNGQDADAGKARVYCNCTASAVVNNSLNISSVTDHGNGYGNTFSFTNAMTDAEYISTHWGKMSGGSYGAPWENDSWKSAGSYRINYSNHNPTTITIGEAQRLNIIVMGDVA